jgi:hypothetical protein
MGDIFTVAQSGSRTTNLAVWAALVTAVGSLAVAVVNYLGGKRREQELAKLQQKLTGEQAQLDARLAYEYEALKRLYTELQPLLFQLSESCESAYNRIAGLAETARESPPWRSESSYAFQTAFRLMEPLAILRLCRERLTVLDLSLEKGIADQYEVMKQLYRSWTNSRELAAATPELDYDPFPKDRPDGLAHDAVHARQHLSVGQLELLIDALIIRDVGAEKAADRQVRSRCMSYGEFVRKLEDVNSDVQDIFSMLTGILQEPHPKQPDVLQVFHPRQRPVLWRILLAQAQLCRWFMEESRQSRQLHPADAIPVNDRRIFDWRSSENDGSFDEAVTGPFQAVQGYLRNVFVQPLGRASPKGPGSGAA